jgi:hypothetical protein
MRISKTGFLDAPGAKRYPGAVPKLLLGNVTRGAVIVKIKTQSSADFLG